MIHKVLRQNAQEYGGFTDLFILGTFRRYNAATKTWGSDFTAADDSLTVAGTGTVAAKYNLIQMTETTPAAGVTQAAVPRFTVGYPLAQVCVKYPFLNSADDPKLDVGVAGSLTAATNVIAGTAADLELQDRVALPVAAGVPLAINTVTQWLVATVTNTTNPVNTLTPKATNPATVGVDIWIYVCLLPYKEWVLNRDA